MHGSQDEAHVQPPTRDGESCPRARRRYGSSQDAVVDRAVEELDRAVRDEAEASRWAEAAEDPEFTTEAAQIAAGFDEPDTWPA